MTKNGKLILAIIEASRDHLTADEVFIKAKEKNDKIVLATVYNNLNMLYEQGLIRKIPMQNGPDRFDRLVKHDHLICAKCGKISDAFIKDITPMIEKSLNIKILSYDLQISYICEDCKKK